MGYRLFLDIFREFVRTRPMSVAIRVFGNGDEETQSITFAELDEASDLIAGALLTHGGASRTVILACETALAFASTFLGCLKGGIIAVPAPAGGSIDNRRRLVSIAQTVPGAPILTDRPIDWLSGSGLPAGTKVLEFERLLDTGERRDFHQPPEEDIAFIQFSSGSTAEPKGVCVSHGNLAANLFQLRRDFFPEPSIISASWMPWFHDMGLIGGLLAPLSLGQPGIQIPTEAFFRRPLRWLKAISGERNVVSGGPCSAFLMCSRLARPADIAGLDLSGWRVAYCGAETVRAAVLDRFADRFAEAGFRRENFLPCYGLAEASLLVSAGSYGRKQSGGGHGRVSCGTPVESVKIRIGDEDGRPVGKVGRVWIAGPNVVSKVWSPEQQAALPAPLRALEESDDAWYDTGDIGMIEEGQLFIIDRANDVLIVNGRNVHAADIEELAHRHAAEMLPLRSGFDCAAFSVEGREKDVHVLLCEVSRTMQSPGMMKDFASRVGADVLKTLQLPLRVEFVARGQLLRTTSGKIRRHANKVRFQEGGFGLLEATPERMGEAPVS